MSNPFRAILSSEDVIKLWDDLGFTEQQLLLEKLHAANILTEPEMMAAVTYTKLSELSRLGAVMDIITEFVINRISDEPPQIGPDGSVKVGF